MHKIQYTTGGKWEVLTLNNFIITFECDIDVCSGTLFIDFSKEPMEYIRVSNGVFQNALWVSRQCVAT